MNIYFTIIVLGRIDSDLKVSLKSNSFIQDDGLNQETKTNDEMLSFNIFSQIYDDDIDVSP